MQFFTSKVSNMLPFSRKHAISIWSHTRKHRQIPLGRQTHDRAESRQNEIANEPVSLQESGDFSEGIITLSSTFNQQTKTIPSAINAKLTNSPRANLNMYCCGPTVYDHSHLGHAISYIRCDLVTRSLRTFGNLNIYFAMNITNIDDKIIAKSAEAGVDYISFSNEYYQSFRNDMDSLRVIPADSYLKVTDKVDVIADYIRQIYDKGFAYYSPESGDINFDYGKFVQFYGIKNDIHNTQNLQTTKSRGKRSPKDFSLWKASKENEPKWPLQLAVNNSISGRPGKLPLIWKPILNLNIFLYPGWHVECSALSSYVFGTNLDIHFGGYDLIFPHHHCESCCSHAHQFEPAAEKPLYSSSKVWLHSGHLILRTEVWQSQIIYLSLK